MLKLPQSNTEAIRAMLKFKINGLDGLRKRLEGMEKDARDTAARLNQTVVETPLTPDERGFVDYECPQCIFGFKISTNSPTAKATTCPSCSHKDQNATWATANQINCAFDNARSHARSVFGEALSGQHESEVHMPSATINVMREGRWLAVGLPAPATKALRLERNCNVCGCNFSFVGAAFFCPACGNAPIEETFRQTIKWATEASGTVGLLTSLLNPDDAANIRRTIVEKYMADLVTCFQLTAQHLYEQKAGKQSPLNAFQRLEGHINGDALWQNLFGKSYTDYLSSSEYTRLRIYFQRRHVLAHANGLVDQIYIDRSGDTTYSLGQRLVVRPEDVEDFAEIVDKLVTAMQNDCR